MSKFQKNKATSYIQPTPENARGAKNSDTFAKRDALLFINSTLQNCCKKMLLKYLHFCKMGHQKSKFENHMACGCYYYENYGWQIIMKKGSCVNYNF